MSPELEYLPLLTLPNTNPRGICPSDPTGKVVLPAYTTLDPAGLIRLTETPSYESLLNDPDPTRPSFDITTVVEEFEANASFNLMVPPVDALNVPCAVAGFVSTALLEFIKESKDILFVPEDVSTMIYAFAESTLDTISSSFIDFDGIALIITLN
tara:strand:+ start:814 stop:1278 length:465 start_codon:yes stop_codon:yes gene_type:complete